MNTSKVSEHIVNWLRNYAQNAKQKGYVIGVSGGIDSAVVSTLCAKTGLDVIVVEMPIHQHSDQVNRAKNHMNWLTENFKNVKQYSFDLTDVYDSFKSKMTSVLGEQDPNKEFLTLANTRSRMRMVTLYSIAGLNSLLVAGTGNKVEDFGIGFFTKYGDGGIDLSPIGELMKSEVYDLGAYLGVGKDILGARPTDGLWDDGRTDEDQIGATYNELEWVMNSFTESELVNVERFDGLTERQIEVIKIYKQRHYVNAHKMCMPEICSLKDIK